MKPQTLKTRRDFLRVAGKRRKWAAPGLVLQAAPTPHAVSRRSTPLEDSLNPISRIRFGLTVSKKVGNAVRRNRARRRLRSLVFGVLALEARADHDYVLIGRHCTPDRAYGALENDLRQALDRMKLRAVPPAGPTDR